MKGSERLKPWRAKPPPEVAELVQRVPSTRFYLVQRSGPTSFIMREEGSDRRHRVLLGATPSCSCSPGSSSGGCKELCMHILFVMIKVLRVPPSNPLVWQLFLNDRELDEVLRCTNAPHLVARKDKPRAASSADGEVDRKPLSEEEPCPICYEDMTAADETELVYCRSSCGNNVHGRCMRVWSDHQSTTGQSLTCPLCRGDWGDFKWRPVAIPKRKKPHREAGGIQGSTHHGTKCAGCRASPIQGKRFRCLVCAELSLCEECFQAGQHPQHPMACRETTSSSETVVEREVLMPTASSLAPHKQQQQAGGAGDRGTRPGQQRPLARRLSATTTRVATGQHVPDNRDDGAHGSNGLEDLLAIGRAAGLPVEAAERAVESSGFSFSNVSGCSSSTARAAAGHLVKGMTKGPKNTAKSSGKNRVRSNSSFNLGSKELNGKVSGLLPSLDVVGGSYHRGLKSETGEPSASPSSLNHPFPMPVAQRKALVKRTTISSGAEAPSGTAGSALELASAGLSGKALGTMALDPGCDAVRALDQPQLAASDGASRSFFQTRRNSTDLPSINMDPRLGGTLCGQGLGIRDPEETADEALAHFGGDMGSLPPGETLGGKLGRRSGLPAIRKGMTTISKTEAPLDGAEEALEGLCIGNRRLLDAERSFAEASGSKVPGYPLQVRRPHIMKSNSTRPPRPISLVADGQQMLASARAIAEGQADLSVGVLGGRGGYLNVLESFFEGPEFDPMFNNAGHAAGLPSAMQAPNAQGLQGDDSESSHGPRSLPVTLSIPLVVTDGEAEAWELGVSSPTKGMITQPFQLSGSLPSSPSKYLPPWLTDSRELDNYDDDFESFDC